VSERHWLSDEAKASVERAIQELEMQSAAELVVTVRRISGHYRDADLVFAALTAFVAILFYVYFPITFPDDPVPPAILLLFLASAFFCSQIAWLRRLFVSKARLRRETERAARAEFFAQGISATRGRSGLLVYVSLFEREVEVVCDIAVSQALLGASGEQAISRLYRSVKEGGVTALTSALAALGGVLSQSLPRLSDDTNELPDRVMP